MEIIWGSLLDHLGVILGSIGDRLGIIWESFGDFLGPRWAEVREAWNPPPPSEISEIVVFLRNLNRK